MRISLRWLILALVLVPMLLVTFLLFLSAKHIIVGEGELRLEDFRTRLLEQKKRELVYLTDVAYQATKKYYEQSHPARIGSVLEARGLEFKATLMRYYEEHKERFPVETIQQLIIDIVKSYRFDDGVGYFWINDFHPRMICHPISPDLDGGDLSDYKDSQGVYLFNEMVSRCKADGKGFVSYRWKNPKTGREERKLSFVFTFEPFGWIIGTGEYASVLRERLQSRAKATIESLRYSDSGYFWICDFHPRMVAHPTMPELNGVDLSDYKDPDGVRLFCRAVELCKRKGRGFLQYKFKKPGSGKVVPKLTFVRSFKHWRWIIGTGVYLDDIEEAVARERTRVERQVRSLVERFTSVALPVLLLLGLAAVLLAGRLVNSPMERLISSIEGFDNDLTMKVEGNFHFEFIDLVDCFNGLISSLRTLVARLGQVTKRLTVTASDISGAVESQAAQLTQQSAAITEITATVEEMSASSGQIAENAEKVLEAAKEAFELSKNSAKAVSEISRHMERIHQDNEARREDVGTLGDRSREISEVMELINDIAEQTKLIAFNAALEASSAGEAGKRFSVVAAEIRSLADTVMDSTGEIESKLNDVREVVSRLIERSRLAGEGVADGLASSKATVQVLERMVEGATETMTAARQISFSTQQQRTASSQVVAAMREIKDGAAETAESIKKINEVGHNLRALSEELEELVGRFKTGED